MTRKRKSNKKVPQMAPHRPEEEAFLRRWRGAKTSPSFFEKFDKDPVYNSAVKSRTDEDGITTLGTAWGIGKPRGPKGS